MRTFNASKAILTAFWIIPAVGIGCSKDSQPGSNGVDANVGADVSTARAPGTPGGESTGGSGGGPATGTVPGTGGVGGVTSDAAVSSADLPVFGGKDAAADAQGPSSTPMTPINRTPPVGIGTMCTIDADCPAPSICVNPLSIKISGATGSLSTSIELYTSALAWKGGYCSPRCRTDADCSGGDVQGTCRYKYTGRTLYLGGVAPDVCETGCSKAQACPGSLTCAGGSDCKSWKNLNTCLPCEVRPAVPPAAPVVPSCPADVTALAAEYAKSICAKNDQCCAIDRAGCLSGVSKTFNEVYPNLTGIVAQGGARIDCAKFSECLSGVLATSCDKWPGESGYFGADPGSVEACHQFVIPLVPVGQACTQDYSCVDGFCWDTEGESGKDIKVPADRKCHAYAATGGACAMSKSDVGAQDKVCSPTADTCTAAACQSKRAYGQTCASDSDCQSGNCDGTPKTCTKPDTCAYEPSKLNLGGGCTVSGRGATGNLTWLLAIALVANAIRRRRR